MLICRTLSRKVFRYLLYLIEDSPKSIVLANLLINVVVALIGLGFIQRSSTLHDSFKFLLYQVMVLQ